MGNSIASQKAVRRERLSSGQLSLSCFQNSLKKKVKEKGELERNDHMAYKRRRLSSTGGKDEGAIRVKVVLTKEEAALLLSMLSESENIGGVSSGFCGVVRSHEWKPSLQRIEEGDEFC